MNLVSCNVHSFISPGGPYPGTLQNTKLAGKRKTQCRTHDMPQTDCRAQPLLPWPADGVLAGVALGLLSRALLLQLVRPKSS